MNTSHLFCLLLQNDTHIVGKNSRFSKMAILEIPKIFWKCYLAALVIHMCTSKHEGTMLLVLISEIKLFFKIWYKITETDIFGNYCRVNSALSFPIYPTFLTILVLLQYWFEWSGRKGTIWLVKNFFSFFVEKSSELWLLYRSKRFIFHRVFSLFMFSKL